MNLKNFPTKLDSKTSSLRIKVPENLDLALEGLIRKVLREQPKTDDIYSLAADYFEALVKIREKAGMKFVDSQICPFHNDEDANEMIKLANTFPKPPPTGDKFSSNEKNNMSLKKAQKWESTGEVFGEKIDGSEKESEKIIFSGGQNSSEDKTTNGAEPSEELKVGSEQENFPRSDPIKESVEKAPKERKVGVSAAEDQEEPEEDLEKEVPPRSDGLSAAENDSSVASRTSDEKGKTAGDENENFEKRNEVEKNKEISNAEADRREEVVGYVTKIRKQGERKAEENVKDKDKENQSAQRDAEGKTILERPTNKDEVIEGPVRTEAEGETNKEDSESGDKVLGKQKQEANVKAEIQNKEQKTESCTVSDEVNEKEVEKSEQIEETVKSLKEEGRKISEKEVEKSEQIETVKSIKEEEQKISEKEKDKCEERQRNMDEQNEEMTSEEKEKFLDKGIYESGFQEESKIPPGDENEMKIEQQSEEETKGMKKTEESSRGSDDKETSQVSMENSGAADKVPRQSLEEEGVVNETTKSESEERKTEVEFPEENTEEEREAGQEEKEQKQENNRKEEIVKVKENVGFEKQEMKKYKDQQVSPEQETVRAKISDLEDKKLEEMKSLKEGTESKTEEQNMTEEKLEKVERNLPTGVDEVTLAADEEIKEKETMFDGNENAEPNPETEHVAAQNTDEETQVTGVIRKEEIAIEARQPSNPETTKENKENFKNEEVKEIEKEDEKIKDDEKSERGKIVHDTPAEESNVTIIEEVAVERKAQTLDEKEIVVGEVESQTRGEKIPEKITTGEEIPKNQKIDEESKQADGLGKELAPEKKENRMESEEKTEVKADVEIRGKDESEIQSERERKEEENEEAGKEKCTLVDKINVIRIEDAEKMEEEPQFERQIKTIATHYYDLLQVPETETSEYKIGRTKDDVPTNADDISTPTFFNSVNLLDVSLASASEIFLNVEKQYNSRGKEEIEYATFGTGERGLRKDEETKNGKEVEDVMRRTEAPAGVGAVPLEPRGSEEINEEINEERSGVEDKTKDKAEEEKDKGSSPEDLIEATSNNGMESDAVFNSVEMRTTGEMVDEGERKVERKEEREELETILEATIDRVPETEMADSTDKTDIAEVSSDKKATPGRAERTKNEYEEKRNSPSHLEESTDREGSSGGSETTLSSAATEIKRLDSGKKNLTRSSTQSLLTSQSLDWDRKNSLVRTRSLSSFRQGEIDVEVWTTIEKELEKAATKIQSKFRGYKTRKKLRRENAVQITTEESSSSSPVEQEYQQGTGEFHDSIVLSVIPR